jgi:endonuclease/exonuclease/phosphatase family metal-dependent hydrolase
MPASMPEPAPKQPMTPKEPVSIVTWNLGWRFGEWEMRQEPIASVLAASGADIVCLQEVWAEANGGPDQAAILAERLGMHCIRHETASNPNLSFSNAVLSRWPVVGSTNIVLPNALSEAGHRRAIHAVIETPRGRIDVVTTHLDHRFDGSATRSKQLKTICAHINQIERDPTTDFPVVFCGDFNATPDSDEIRTLTGRCPPFEEGQVFTDAWEVAGDETPGYTWRKDNPMLHLAQWPNRRLDYIMTSWPRTSKQGTPIACRLIGHQPVNNVMASDHAGLQAILR